MNDPAETILFLGQKGSPLYSWLSATEQSVLQSEAEIAPEFIDEHRVHFLVSYGYRYILKPDLLAKLPDRAVNLHISLLPWNRGADPNLWSFLDDTPKGVSIHYLDDGIDTGDVLFQREVVFSDTKAETLATTYDKLNLEIQSLFQDQWNAIKKGRCRHRPQTGPGSFHTSADRTAVSARLTNGWETPISEL